MLIYLVGMMGCGKTTAAKAFGKKYGYQVFDLDKLIETSTGESIAHLFETKGENHFRLLEAKLLRAIVPEKECIISTGGGTFCNLENQKYINSTGTSIYLATPIGKIANRLKNSKVHRPVIEKAIEDAELNKVLESILNERERFYKKANYTIDTEKLSTEELIRQIARLIK